MAELRPLYDESVVVDGAHRPGQAPFRRGTSAAPAPWDVRVVVAESGVDLVAELEAGGTSVHVDLGRGLGVADLAEVLHDVDPTGVVVAVDAGAHHVAACEALRQWWREAGFADVSVKIELGADPIGVAARRGESVDLAPAVELAARFAGSGVRVLAADGAVWDHAGASDAWTLGLTLGSAFAYVRALDEAGVPLQAAFDQVVFRVRLGPEPLRSIATLRALRWLWGRIGELCGVQARARVHVRPSDRVRTARDPHVNLLRDTAVIVAGAIGGADAISGAAFDELRGPTTTLSRRLARTSQLVLRHEAHLDRVVDPAGGAYAIEALTDALGEEAWAVLQELESAGGVAAALASGRVEAAIDETAAQRARAVARRERAITGVSQFPDLGEPPPAMPVTVGSGRLGLRRDAVPFETLRDRSDAMLGAFGARPRVTLLQLGSAAEHGARTSFARNLVQAGGLKAAPSGDQHDVDSAVESAAAAGSTVVLLCGTDTAYAELAAPLATALTAAGHVVWLAGKPGEHEAAWSEAGVAGFVYLGCDVLDALEHMWQEVQP